MFSTQRMHTVQPTITARVAAPAAPTTCALEHVVVNVHREPEQPVTYVNLNFEVKTQWAKDFARRLQLLSPPPAEVQMA